MIALDGEKRDTGSLIINPFLSVTSFQVWCVSSLNFA